MIVREQQCIERADRHTELIEPDGRATPGIDQQSLLARLYQGRRAEAVRARDRRAGAEQRDAEVIWHRFLSPIVATRGAYYHRILAYRRTLTCHPEVPERKLGPRRMYGPDAATHRGHLISV